MPDSILQLEHICHTYNGETEGGVEILQDTSAHISSGELVALVGSSGLGKSTLLHIAGLMETPTSGTVLIAGQTAKNDKSRTKIRLNHLGFVFQFHHLLPEFSALENLSLIGRIAGQKSSTAISRAKTLLDRVGLSHRLHHAPATLSGGECQRVAIARALMNKPDLLLLDEPTGNLDADTALEVFGLIEHLVTEEKLACLYVTHNNAQAARANRCLTIENRQLVETNV